MLKARKKELIRILKDCRLCVNMVKTEEAYKDLALSVYCGNLIIDLEREIKRLGGSIHGASENQNESN